MRSLKYAPEVAALKLEVSELGRPTLSLLTDDEIELVHLASLDILKNIGVYVPMKEALRMLSDNGAEVDYEKSIARIPPEVVMEYLRKAPSEFTLYARDPKFNMNIKSGNIYFGFGPGPTRFWDYETGLPRAASLADLDELMKLADTLDNFHFVSELVTPNGVPPELAAQYQWASALNNSRKHVMMYIGDAEGVRDGVKMASAAAGGEEELVKKPIVDFLGCVGQPLSYEKGLLAGFIEAAKHRLPIYVQSGAMAGATGPVTLAGTLAQCNAEILSGITLIQMVNPGNPVIYTNWARIFDMKAANVTFGSPEFALLRIAIGQLVRRYYNVPFCNSCFQTDSKVPDIQSGYDKYITLISLLCGSHVVLGETVAGANFTDPVGWLVDDELASAYLQIMKGFKVDNDALALDVIRSVGVGPGRNFLATKHTRDHLREQHWLDHVITDRRAVAAWERAGRKDTRQRAREKLKEKLMAYRPTPLPPSAKKEIDIVIEEAKKRSGS